MGFSDIWVFLSLLSLALCHSTTFASLSESKISQLNTVFEGQRYSFYCACPFKNRKALNPTSCSLSHINTKQEKKVVADRIAWDPILPLHVMGNQLACWRGQDSKDHPACRLKDGTVDGASCCAAVHPGFRKAYNDLINWVPVLAATKELRKGIDFGRIGNLKTQAKQKGQCELHVNQQAFQPRPAARGEVARILLYMVESYGNELSFSFTQEYLKMLYEWAGLNPVTDTEITRNNRICLLQGTGNPFVTECPRIEKGKLN